MENLDLITIVIIAANVMISYKGFNDFGFFEKYKFQGEILTTSAKTGENVEKAFEMLGREILKNSLKKCPQCGKHYPTELKFCQYCGSKTN